MKYLLFLLSLLTFLPLSAQKERTVHLRWGATVGLNRDPGKLNFSTDRNRYGFNAAVRSELFFSEAASRMYLDAELGMLNLGWKSYYKDYMIGMDGMRQDFEGTDEGDAYYLHLPVHAGYRWAFSRVCALYVDAGPYVSVGLFGKAKSKDLINHTETEGDTFDSIRRFDWGLGMRLGLEFAEHYRVGAGLDYGLQELSKYGGRHNNNLTFSIGYMF